MRGQLERAGVESTTPGKSTVVGVVAVTEKIELASLAAVAVAWPWPAMVKY